MKLKGYTGKIINVDLTRSTVKTEPIREDWLEPFIGGSGLGAKYLYEMTDEKTNPLGPENPLIFMAGPFTGTPVPLSGRHAVVSRSPLTNIFGESDVGGTWGAQLKKAGFDGIIVTGKSEKPVYLWINEEKVEIRDASHLWGKDTYEIDPILLKETHEKAAVSAIGQAGENQVLIAAIMTDGKEGRAAGRCGLGAVMGSKKLKALVAYGTKKVVTSSPEEVVNLPKEYSAMIVKNAENFRKYGTAGSLSVFESMGTLPIQNWKFIGRWEESAEKINGFTLSETLLTGRYFCDACILGCGRKVKVEQGPYAGVDGAGPEYETLALLGSNCLIDDLEALCYANELCNRFGLDTISTGGVIGFGMEAYEKGLIDQEDTGGIELRWGSSQALIEMIKMIAHQKGFGEVLGKGVKRASEIIGKNSVEFAMHTKGLEFPAHDPRGYNAGATGFATSSRGACHLSGLSHTFERVLKSPEMGIPEPIDRFEIKGKGILTAKSQNLMGMMDSLKLCKFILFGGITVTHIAKWYQLVTGREMSIDDFAKTGERIFNLKRLYNVRLGISRKDDTLPFRSLTFKRIGKGITPSLPSLGHTLGEYYEYRGWSEDGIPTPEKLKELGLE
ncbi:MAG: aldehyde ferredoxin oxidoreductase family protein [Deltaproteobacteria bacterium]|nr:aldehyde ferredoxin oxidoreductase family protein [Deltaproteobacteria bacterium]MBM4323616.1 aldehyde ferredoxin oxidoreductase family protein [Deltaproteobacteria bacterium]